MTDRDRQWPATAGAVAAGLVFAALAVLVAIRYPPLMHLDHGVATAAYNADYGNNFAVGFWRLIAVAFDPWLVRTALCLLAVALFVRGRRRTAAWLVAVVFVSLAAGIAAKALFTRPRPVFSSPIETVSGYSFPSGHANSAGMAAAALVLLTSAVVSRPLRFGLAALWCALAVLVAVDRIALGVHYLSDVTGGLALGAFSTLAVTVAFGGVGIRRARTPALTATPVQPRRRLAVILNPVKVINATVFRRRVEAATAAAGWDEPLWFETTVDDAGGAMAEAALESGADLVAIAGGDGTVRTACAKLASRGVPVGILATGTGNLLARNLGLPLVLESALDVLFTGQDRPIDMVRIEGDDLARDHFVVMAGLGLDAAIMAGAQESIKAKVGWPAYALAALRHVRYPAVRVDISVDDAAPERFRARTVVIGNVGNLQAGIPLLPEAAIDDGRLDVVVIAPRRSLGWLVLLWRVLLRRPGTDERLGRMTGQRVVVRAAASLPRQLDGDLVTPGHELRAEVVPSALLVRVPR